MSRLRSSTQPGFAMPLVVLLSLVVGISVSVMLERQAAQRAIVARQLDGYREHHAARGLRELADGWRETASAEALTEFIQSGPREVMRVDLDDGSIITVVVGEGQDRLGTSVSGDTAQAIASARALAYLQQKADRIGGAELAPRLLERWVRTVGPMPASLRSTSPEVIEAAANAVTWIEGEPQEDLANQLQTSLLRLRRSSTSESGENDIRAAANELGLDGDPAQSLMQLLTLTPTVYEARVEVWDRNVRPGGATRPRARYIGLFEIGGRGSDRQLSARSAFLTWDDRTPPPEVTGKPDEWELPDAVSRGAYGG